MNQNGRSCEFDKKQVIFAEEGETLLLRYGWTKTPTDPVSGFGKPFTVMEDMERRICALRGLNIGWRGRRGRKEKS